MSEIEKLKPFHDVVPALEKLRSKGYKLAILSNGDRDMLEAVGPYIGFARHLSERGQLTCFIVEIASSKCASK